MRVQPLQREPDRLVVRARLRVARLRRRAEERLGDTVARREVRVVEPQQDDHVHHPAGREVVGRKAAHGRRRPLHLPADQEARCPRPAGCLVGVEERDSQRQQGHLQLQDRRRALLLLRRRPDADRAAARLEVGQGPGQLQGSSPGRQRPLHHELLLAAGHEVLEESALLAEGPAQGRHRLLPGLHVERPGEPGPGERQGSVGQSVHPEHQELLSLTQQGQPLLVPAGLERLGLHQPEEPDPQGRGDPARDGVRDRPRAGLEDRRVRLRARRRTRPGS